MICPTVFLHSGEEWKTADSCWWFIQANKNLIKIPTDTRNRLWVGWVISRDLDDESKCWRMVAFGFSSNPLVASAEYPLKWIRCKRFKRYFYSTSLPLAVLDRFVWHYQASVHCSKQCRFYVSAPSREKIIGHAENRTLGCWVRSKCATSVLCTPSQFLRYVCFLRPYL